MDKKLINKKVLFYNKKDILCKYQEFNKMGKIIYNIDFINNTNTNVIYDKNNLLKEKNTYSLIDKNLINITEKFYYNDTILKRIVYKDMNKNIKNIFIHDENGFISSIEKYVENKLLSLFYFNKINKNTYEAIDNNIRQKIIYYNNSNNIKQKVIDSPQSKKLICYNKIGECTLIKTSSLKHTSIKRIIYQRNGLIKYIKNKTSNAYKFKMFKNNKDNFRYEIIKDIDDEMNNIKYNI